jgi:cytochrome c peroxidase
VELGRMLWFDTRLSRANDLSCNSCHDLERFGVDGKRVSLGHLGKAGRRNAPSVYNAGGRFAQFWDGRARTLAEQATGPMLNPEEMAMSEADVVTRLTQTPEYVARFHRAFPDDKNAVTLTNAAEAIAAFERGLVTKGRWDRYLEGDAGALTADEVQGLRVFLNVGCVGCHTGPEVGASMYQVAGAIEPWPSQDDQGRFEITGDENDRMVFRVPSLKNVEHTSPYFHDGSVSELPKAVQLMGRVQLGVDLTPEEVGSIVKFLRALSGDVPRDYIARPVLPVSSTSSTSVGGAR